MTPEQQHLWRQTAYLGILTGVWTVISLLGDLALGLNQSYFMEAVSAGIAPAVVEPNSVVDYGLLTGFSVLVFIPRWLLGILFLIMLRHCWIRSDQLVAIEILRLIVTAAVAITAFLGVVQLMTLFYMQDGERYITAGMVKAANLMLSFCLVSGFAIILYHAYAKLPRWLGASMGLFLSASIVYTCISSYPNLTSFFGALLAYFGAIVLAFYMLWVTYTVAVDTHITH